MLAAIGLLLAMVPTSGFVQLRGSLSKEDVQAIRKKLKKSQDEFALMLGVSVATLRNWEQGRRHPHGPARALLKIAAENPKAVEKALGRH